MFLVFQGTSANSEPETKAIASTIQQFKNNIRIYMSFHSFGKSRSIDIGLCKTLDKYLSGNYFNKISSIN